MQDILNKLESARDQFDKQLSVLAQQKAKALVQRSGDEDAEAEGADIERFASRCERELVAELTGDAILGKMLDESEVDRDRGAICADLRQLKRPLKMTPPVPHLLIPPIRYVLLAGIGAVLGVYTIEPLTRLLLGYCDVGLIIGGPVGAALAVATAGYLVENPAVRRKVMIALGVAASAWLAMELLAKTPVVGLWQRMVGKKTGVMQKLRAAAAFLGVVFLLWLARPSRKTLCKQLEKSAEADILAWLRRHLDVMVLLAVISRDGTGAASEGPGTPDVTQVPTQLVAALARLADQRAQSPDVSALVDEVVQEYEQAGFTTPESTECPTVYCRRLEQYYDAFGLVGEGDPIEVVESPVLGNDGSVVKRGTLKKRR